MQLQPGRRVREHHVPELHRDEPVREQQRHGQQRRRHLRQHQRGRRARLRRLQQHRGRRRPGRHVQRAAGDAPGAHAVAEAPRLRRAMG